MARKNMGRLTSHHCYGLTARNVEGVGTEYIGKVNHVLRAIVIADVLSNN